MWRRSPSRRRGSDRLRSACLGLLRYVLPAWAPIYLIRGLQTDSWYVTLRCMTTTPHITTEKDTSTAASTTVLARRTVEIEGEHIAYVDAGEGSAPAALFVHGVLVNADLWRNVIFDVADLRRCIAP